MPAEPTSEPLKASYVWDIESDRIEWQPEAAAVLGLPDLKAVETGEAFASRIVGEHEPAWRAAVLGARASAPQPQGIGYRTQFALRPNETDPEIWVCDDGRWWPGADGRASRAQGVLYRIDARYLETRHLRASPARSARTKISSSDVIAAIEENRLLIALQPVIEAASRKTAFYEALVRLKRTDGTLIPAADFVEEAEMLGLARQVDRRALEMVLALLSRHPKLKLSLNVSSLTAGDRDWIETLERYPAGNPDLVRRLTVELTETAMIHDLKGMRAFIELLRAIGCRIAIDDFGTGYTSFRHLKTLPVDILKIDGVFVKDIPNDRHGRVIVGSLIEMARGLGLETVAEWVSDEKTAEFLSTAGATYLQGFLYASAVPAEELERAGIL